MRVSNPPETSIEAWHSVKNSMPEEHHAKILKALAELKSASAEQISTITNLDHWQVNRRLSELERKQLIYKPGGKVPTKTGRSANLWTLTTPPEPVIRKRIQIPAYSGKKFIQPNLF
jgi:predicted ArsR family transcriptional regulator